MVIIDDIKSPAKRAKTRKNTKCEQCFTHLFNFMWLNSIENVYWIVQRDAAKRPSDWWIGPDVSNYLASLLSLAFDRFSFGHFHSRSHSNSRLHLIGNHADMPRSAISPMARSSSLGWYAHFQNKTTNKSMIRASPFCVELETSWSLQPEEELNASYSLSLSCPHPSDPSYSDSMQIPAP